jgi:hypothetical protein
MTKTLRVLTSSLAIALAPLAAAQTTTTSVDAQANLLDSTAANRGQTQVATRIASSFTNLAGSLDNALALVRALRNGTAVTLTTPTTGTGTGAGTGPSTGIGAGPSPGTGPSTPPGTGTGTGTTPAPTSTTFTPPTGRMGWGNVFIALALAQDSLTRAGILKPTAEQLQAALLGGDVKLADGTTVTLKGVLQMRADGMGWGQIAQASGTKLGPVVSAIKSAQVKVAALPTSGGTSTAATVGGGPKKTDAPLSKGVVTASGASASGGVVAGDSRGNAYGRGVVNAAGGGANVVGASVSAGHGNGVGVVNAAGNPVSTTVTDAQGNSGGNGKDHGKGKGGG